MSSSKSRMCVLAMPRMVLLSVPAIVVIVVLWGKGRKG